VANDELLDDYLYYAWQYVFGQVKAVSYGTVFDTITMKSFADIEIPCPPIEKQREIADILTIFDDKIESNVHLSEILNSTAETIYDGLFNDFKEHDEFKESEIGEIPESYTVATIGDLLNLEYGEGLPEREREGDEYPVYGSNGITGRHEESLVEGPGIIVGRKGVNFGTVELEFGDFWPIDTTFYVDPNDSDELLYLYHVLKDTPFQHLGSDSAVPGLNRNVAHDQEIALPPESEREEFVTKVEPMHRIVDVLEEENRTLEELRDTVLPKLLSGELVLPDKDTSSSTPSSIVNGS
jgi:type I restriction enzyme S subunit